MTLYPIMLNMNGQQAVIIGGGDVAVRKLSDLIDAGANIRIISPEFHDEIIKLSELFKNRLTLIKRGYEKNDLDGAALVFSATNDTDVNRKIFNEAKEKNILINAVDDPPNCSFYIPSFIRKGDLIFSVSTGGASPAMAARLRREMEKHIPENIETILERLNKARTLLKEDKLFSNIDSSQRGEILKEITYSDQLLASLISCKDEEDEENKENQEMIDFLLHVQDSLF
ncbi:MAG: bifunctional precorrin-2 dehydrogenase/sirohydrochlorin ferrochelatase [Spirochaetes bacterium]|nr:bifunctional precorrin-2 dehydrogenase/sirohydrochlorin ferrochelatase [Spirochaetota bacterium]